MSWRQQLLFRLLFIVWLGGTLNFWIWWFQPSHWVTLAGMIFNSLLLSFTFWIPLVMWFFVSRMRQPIPVDDASMTQSVAIVVTKAPSEPWILVRHTLEAMLRQDYPHSYDVWLADERPTPEIYNWCAENGVQISTRMGVNEYHRNVWPRKTRTKEGNLAYFYDMFGYNYEVVAQLDADHVPEHDYLRRMCEPFVDPDVGYVAAPSICDSNASSSWAARGRLYLEAILHGPLQAGCVDYSPSCIGSHYAIRCEALKASGGYLGPELAEDFSTTLLLSAHGWKGAFAINAIAHGEGPPSFTDAMVQEFQWSRSLTTILLSFYPTLKKGLTWKQKLRLSWCLMWYPSFALQMALAASLPTLALLTHLPLVSVSLGEYMLYAILPSVPLVLAALWLKKQGWLRPSNAKIFSWEGTLFQITRWPWNLAGVCAAVLSHALRKEQGFKVTPKGHGSKLSLGIIAPYLVIAALASVIAIGVTKPEQAFGYYTLEISIALVYSITAVAVLALHRR